MFPVAQALLRQSLEEATENRMSYTKLTYHIIFSTKDRRAFLNAQTLPRLVEYIGGIIRNLGGNSIEINGPEDHLHVVVGLSPTVCLSECVRDIKCNSSRWIHEAFPQALAFAWQDEYAAFSVSESALPKVIEYVRNQQEHHKRVSFGDELAALLKRHGVKYDERYL